MNCLRFFPFLLVWLLAWSAQSEEFKITINCLRAPVKSPRLIQYTITDKYRAEWDPTREAFILPYRIYEDIKGEYKCERMTGKQWRFFVISHAVEQEQIQLPPVSLTLSGHRGRVISSAFSPDGTRIVTGSDDKTAKVLDTHTGWVISAVFSPDGTRIVIGFHDETAKVWDAQTGALLHNLPGRTLTVRSGSLSPDVMQIVTGSYDRIAKVWIFSVPPTKIWIKIKRYLMPYLVDLEEESPSWQGLFESLQEEARKEGRGDIDLIREIEYHIRTAPDDIFICFSEQGEKIYKPASAMIKTYLEALFKEPLPEIDFN